MKYIRQPGGEEVTLEYIIARNANPCNDNMGVVEENERKIESVIKLIDAMLKLMPYSDVSSVLNQLAGYGEKIKVKD